MTIYDESLTDTLTLYDFSTKEDVTYYGNLNQANIYFANRLNSDEWDSASDDDKLKALNEATEYLEQLNFIGTPTSTDQLLHFPINNSTLVPIPILKATYELAITALKNIDPDTMLALANLKSSKFGQVKGEYFQFNPQAHILAGILSVRAWRYILPYLVDGQELNLVKVN